MKFQRDVSISYTSHLSTFTSNLDTKNVQHTRYNTWLDDYCLAGITDVSEFGGKYSTSRIKFLRATVPNFLFLGATAPTFLFLGATAPNFLFLGATAPNFLYAVAGQNRILQAVNRITSSTFKHLNQLVHMCKDPARTEQ